MTLHPSKSLITTSALLLLVLALLGVFVLEIYNIRLKNMKISELTNLADQHTEIEALDQSIRIQQSSISGELVIFDRLVLSDNNLVSLIESIENVGKALALDAHIVSVVGKKQDVKSTEPEKVTIVVEARGMWAPVFSFLHALESLPYRVMVSDTSLVKEGESWHLRITLLFYLFN